MVKGPTGQLASPTSPDAERCYICFTLGGRLRAKQAGAPVQLLGSTRYRFSGPSCCARLLCQGSLRLVPQGKCGMMSEQSEQAAAVQRAAQL